VARAKADWHGCSLEGALGEIACRSCARGNWGLYTSDRRVASIEKHEACTRFQSAAMFEGVKCTVDDCLRKVGN